MWLWSGEWVTLLMSCRLFPVLGGFVDRIINSIVFVQFLYICLRVLRMLDLWCSNTCTSSEHLRHLCRHVSNNEWASKGVVKCPRVYLTISCILSLMNSVKLLRMAEMPLSHVLMWLGMCRSLNSNLIWWIPVFFPEIRNQADWLTDFGQICNCFFGLVQFEVL